MSLSFEPMLVGEEIPYSLDAAPKIAAGAALVSASITITLGASFATIDRVSVNGTKVIFWIKALTSGVLGFKVLFTMSDNSIDGDDIRMQIT